MIYLTPPIDIYLEVIDITQITVETIIVEADHMAAPISQITWKYRIDNGPVIEDHPETNATQGNLMVIQASITDAEGKNYHAISHIRNHPQSERSFFSHTPVM